MDNLFWTRNGVQRLAGNRPEPENLNIPIRITPQMYPVHLKAITPNPQSACPLYSAIPPEIRTQIFQYYFLEYTSSKPSHQYSKGKSYYRPDFTAKRLISTSLVLTCRRIYLETYMLPLLSKTPVFYHRPSGSPPPILDTSPFTINPEKRFFSLLQPWQIDLVTSFHIITQLFWLERGDCFGLLCKQKFMQNVRELKITIRRSDWWWNERNEKLCINPYRGNGDNAEHMEDCRRRLDRGEIVPIAKESWARFFADLKALERLEFEFETAEDKREELEDIVKWARTWVFPMGGRGELRASDVVKESEWRTEVGAWNELCPYCHQMLQCGSRNDPRCLEKKRLIRRQLGPMFIIRKVNWYLVRA